MEFEPMLTPREKIPSTGKCPQRRIELRRCGQRAQTLPMSYSGPVSVFIALCLSLTCTGCPWMVSQLCPCSGLIFLVTDLDRLCLSRLVVSVFKPHYTYCLSSLPAPYKVTQMFHMCHCFKNIILILTWAGHSWQGHLVVSSFFFFFFVCVPSYISGVHHFFGVIFAYVTVF